MISNNKNDGKSEIKTILTGDIYKVQNYKDGEIDAIIDVGANIGVFSIMMRMRHPRSKIVAVEPCMETVHYLMKNVNMLNIDVIPYALGNGDDVSIISPDGNLVRNIFISNDQDTYKIKSITLGDIFSSKKLDTSQNYLLKFDCEGAEKFLVGDPISENIIKHSLQTSLEIHFRSEKSQYDFWVDFATYNDWIHDNFSETHSIDYYKSSKHRGYGHYCIKKINV